MGWDRVRREPYRLFFPLGMIFGCLGVSHWLFYALGGNASPSYHASIQLGAYLSCFIVGFLWTALPRMSGTAPASHLELSMALGLLGAQAALLMMRKAVAAQGCYAGLLVLLVAFVARRMATRRSGPPLAAPIEFLWVPIGVGFGLLGSGLLVAGMWGAVPGWLSLSGRVMAQQGFALSVVVGVAGFMAPRLMGRPLPAAQPGTGRRKRVVEILFAAACLGLSFFLEGAGFIRAAYGLRAMVVTVELGWRARWWKPPVVKDFYLRLLWWSLWCVIVGLWAATCWPLYRIAMLHLVLIGGFSLMIFAVGTMVVLSHAGEPEALRRPLLVLRVAAVGVIGSVTARVLADLWPAHYFGWLATAAALWLAAGISWLLFVVPKVWSVPQEGVFERVHEQAKQRILGKPTAAC